MECTKGEFEARDNKIYQKQTYIGGCAGYFEKTAFSDDVDEANAKELVRRWNAFEKDGLVDELRAACDEGHAECERVKMDCKCEWVNLDSLLGRIERIEAAIAKVKA